MSSPITASSILNEEHLRNINESLVKLESAKKEIEMAKRAGLKTGPGGENIDKLDEQVTNLTTQLKQIKQVYFPNQ